MTHYARSDDIVATLTRRLSDLLPHVIRPDALSDDELDAHGIVRCAVQRPALDWWQSYGDPLVEDTEHPVRVIWPVLDRPMTDIRAHAWERVKGVRAAQRAAGVAYAFPDGTVGHIQIRDPDVTNLLAIHAAATTALMMQHTAPIPFTDAENVTHWLAPSDALALAMAAFAHGAAVHVTSQILRADIDDADTVVDVLAVQWPAED